MLFLDNMSEIWKQNSLWADGGFVPELLSEQVKKFF